MASPGQKMKFSKLRIWSHLLKKSLMKNFNLGVVNYVDLMNPNMFSISQMSNHSVIQRIILIDIISQELFKKTIPPSVIHEVISVI